MEVFDVEVLSELLRSSLSQFLNLQLPNLKGENLPSLYFLCSHKFHFFTQPKVIESKTLN